MRRLVLITLITTLYCATLSAQEGQRAHTYRDGEHYVDIEGVAVIGNRQLLDIRQKLWSSDALDCRISRNIALAHTGVVERHEDKQPDARHDRLFDDTLLLH